MYLAIGLDPRDICSGAFARQLNKRTTGEGLGRLGRKVDAYLYCGRAEDDLDLSAMRSGSSRKEMQLDQATRALANPGQSRRKDAYDRQFARLV